nr:hypothetical protein [Ardenticatena sp.]
MPSKPVPADTVVTVYIAAANDVAAERDALARMVAELPVTLAFHVVQSPLEGPIDQQALAEADLFVLVLGHDIRAPVGLEWRLARRAQRPLVVAVKAGVSRTPAGREFLHTLDVPPHTYQTVGDLVRLVQQRLAMRLLEEAQRLALDENERAALQRLVQAESAPQSDASRGEAGESAVILSRERFRPSRGHTVE